VQPLDFNQLEAATTTAKPTNTLETIGNMMQSECRLW
jgi:hypothetical protein